MTITFATDMTATAIMMATGTGIMTATMTETTTTMGTGDEATIRQPPCPNLRRSCPSVRLWSSEALSSCDVSAPSNASLTATG